MLTWNGSTCSTQTSQLLSNGHISSTSWLAGFCFCFFFLFFFLFFFFFFLSFSLFLSSSSFFSFVLFQVILKVLVVDSKDDLASTLLRTPSVRGKKTHRHKTKDTEDTDSGNKEVLSLPFLFPLFLFLSLSSLFLECAGV